MHISLKVLSSSLLGAALVFATAAPALSIEVIDFRSGNGLVGQPDAQITFLGTGGCCGAEFGAFTPLHFAIAAGGSPALVIGQAHPAWTPTLTCDPEAQWVGTNPTGAPETALYAQGFNVTTGCIHRVTVDICWMADDRLGGVQANPEGIYVNGTALTGTSGGNFTFDTTVGPIDITSLVNTGPNYIYFYNVDIGAAVSGVNYSVHVVVEECPTPTQSSTWSGIKSRLN
jgi:hypothetical protein